MSYLDVYCVDDRCQIPSLLVFTGIVNTSAETWEFVYKDLIRHPDHLERQVRFTSSFGSWDRIWVLKELHVAPAATLAQNLTEGSPKKITKAFKF